MYILKEVCSLVYWDSSRGSCKYLNVGGTLLTWVQEIMDLDGCLFDICSILPLDQGLVNFLHQESGSKYPTKHTTVYYLAQNVSSAVVEKHCFIFFQFISFVGLLSVILELFYWLLQGLWYTSLTYHSLHSGNMLLFSCYIKDLQQCISIFLLLAFVLLCSTFYFYFYYSSHNILFYLYTLLSYNF